MVSLNNCCACRALEIQNSSTVYIPSRPCLFELLINLAPKVDIFNEKFERVHQQVLCALEIAYDLQTSSTNADVSEKVANLACNIF